MLKVGDQAPDFSGLDQEGNRVNLKDYREKKLIIFFYPKDNTPGCTNQVCNLRDHYSKLLKQGYALVGISADTQRKHRNFIKKYDLPFKLIADTDREIIQKYYCWGKKKFMGREYEGIIRTTFVIDEKGEIIRIIDKVKTTAHAEQILD